MMPPLFITLACAVLLVGALDVPCTVTQEAGRTVYRVPEFSATSATDCEYKWNNGTDHPLATNGGMEPTGLVVNHSISTLTTARCLEGIVYKRDCRSEGVQREAKCICPNTTTHNTTTHNTTTHYNATAGLSVEEPGAVLLVGALDVPCTVTQEAGRTVYRVPEFSATSATDCEYKWNNGTDHPLAVNGGMETTGLVVNHSISTLTTARCLEGIVYKRDCRSEGVQREVKCICPNTTTHNTTTHNTTTHNTTTHYNATAGLSVEEPGAVLLVDALACTVTQEAGRTVYRVPEFSATSATDCEYSWNNATDHPLAVNGGMETTGLVVNHSISTLTTARCLEGIVYKRDCRSEGVQREVKCICPNTTTHNTTAHNTTTHYNATAGLSVEEQETPHESPVIVSVVVVVVILVIVVILAVALILWCKKLKNPSQTGSTSYTEVPMQSLRPKQR